MDESQSDMDFYESDDCSEDLSISLKRKFAKSPSLSTINEEASEASVSGRSLASSKGSGSIDHKQQANEMSSKRKRKLFHRKDDDMELDLPSSGNVDAKPPPKDQTVPNAPCKRGENERNAEQEIRLKTRQTPKTPLRDRNQPNMPINLALKSEGSSFGNCEPANPWENANNQFDMLFVSGIFNSVKPAPPTNKELQTMYINNSSDDDDPATPKKRQKISPLAKNKVQSKITFKKASKA